MTSHLSPHLSPAPQPAPEEPPEEPLAAIQMGVAADGQPVWFQPHSALCAAFAEKTSGYLRELSALSAEMRELAAAIPPARRYGLRQPTTRERLHAERQAQLQRLVARMVNLRGELNAWFVGAALVCPDCATALSTQPWPLPGSENLISEVLRREQRQRMSRRHAAQH